jgi:hypothetical protein
MTNLIEMLQQLSELDPATCRLSDMDEYIISGYRFWLELNGEFRAGAPGKHCIFTGRPALAWLRDAVEAAIEARGWYYETSFWIYDSRPGYRVYMPQTKSRGVEDTAAEALLAAFVEAVRTEKGER